jgi:hypothetical protein
VVFSVLAIVVVAVGVTGYLYYDHETRPNRSAPDVVVDNYLREYLVHRDDAKAQLYACADQSGLTDLAALRSDLERREREFSVKIAVSWPSLTVSTASDKEAAVDTTLILSTATEDGPQEQREVWHFITRDSSGWRVCEAHKKS